MRINSSLENSIFRIGLDEKSYPKPVRLALYITILYIVSVSVYIWFSGKISV